MSEYLVLDTSAITNDGHLLLTKYDRMKPECVVVLSGLVLNELDRRKTSRNVNKARFAREAARRIEDLLMKNERISSSYWNLGERSLLLLDFNKWTFDRERDWDAAIIEQAGKYVEECGEDEDVILVSRDCIQRIRVMAAGLETLDPMEIQAKESCENMYTRINGGLMGEHSQILAQDSKI